MMALGSFQSPFRDPIVATYRYCVIITAVYVQCYLLFPVCKKIYNCRLLCGVLVAGLPDHTQCLFHEVLTLPHAVALHGQFVQCLALGVQGCV